MSILPNSSLTFLKTSRICSRLVTSILIARDLRPILRIASAVAFECTQPCDTATCASMLPCEPYEDAAQAIRATRRLSRDGGGNAHLQHAVRDQAWQTDGPREVVVEVDRVAVARRLGVGGDLLPGEGHLP